MGSRGGGKGAGPRGCPKARRLFTNSPARVRERALPPHPPPSRAPRRGPGRAARRPAGSRRPRNAPSPRPPAERLPRGAGRAEGLALRFSVRGAESDIGGERWGGRRLRVRGGGAGGGSAPNSAKGPSETCAAAPPPNPRTPRPCPGTRPLSDTPPSPRRVQSPHALPQATPPAGHALSSPGSPIARPAPDHAPFTPGRPITARPAPSPCRAPVGHAPSLGRERRPINVRPCDHAPPLAGTSANHRPPLPPRTRPLSPYWPRPPRPVEWASPDR
ncbi:vegetative cell wall protein gp1-like [Tachyglossus aculeatus]|uniref:vegetative cell wall protein gp1-like n=1 Tax=Tachyglossus aculeatus TaxID=9261 RepID=UPI0018F281EB|nr:vegetative cell wall protein gp1-like [Tachyglossus aculeatus]